MARAGFRAGKPGHGSKNHAASGGGNGQLFRHPGLVLQRRGPAFRRAETAAEFSVHHGHAAGRTDPGRAHKPAGSHRGGGLSQHCPQDKPGAGNDHTHHGASAGGYLPRGGQSRGHGPGTDPDGRRSAASLRLPEKTGA